MDAPLVMDAPQNRAMLSASVIAPMAVLGIASLILAILDGPVQMPMQVWLHWNVPSSIW